MIPVTLAQVVADCNATTAGEQDDPDRDEDQSRKTDPDGRPGPGQEAGESSTAGRRRAGRIRRVGAGDDLQAHPRHLVQTRVADDGALSGAVDGHAAPGTGAQRAHVGSDVQAQTVLTLPAELELDALDLPVVLGAEPQIPLAAGHVDARERQVGTGGAAGVAGGGDLQRLAPVGVGGGVWAYGAGLGGENPGTRVLHIRQHL